MKQSLHILLIIVLGLTFFNSTAFCGDDPKARAIMQKVDDRDDGNNAISDMTMILIDKSNNRRIRKIKSFTKDFGVDTYRIMFFQSPADVRDTGFLTYDYDTFKKDDDQWLYLPALKKTKRIASSDKSGSFMGSDFNYSDMNSMDLEDFDYEIKKEAKLKGHKVWIIQSTPRSKDIMEEIGYKKGYVYVRKDIYYVVGFKKWTYEGNYTKTMLVKSLKKIDGIWTTQEMHVKKKLGRKVLHQTILKFNNIRYNQNLKKSMFTIRRLEKGL